MSVVPTSHLSVCHWGQGNCLETGAADQKHWVRFFFVRGKAVIQCLAGHKSRIGNLFTGGGEGSNAEVVEHLFEWSIDHQGEMCRQESGDQHLVWWRRTRMGQQSHWLAQKLVEASLYLYYWLWWMFIIATLTFFMAKDMLPPYWVTILCLM